ncbi:MAG TPA: DUF4440 domain-containing protein [Hyphomicrobiaceae bacterium]|nr:DUF4440 domain-containing protein [Hyphomicrobiaceae bacterium]
MDASNARTAIEKGGKALGEALTARNAKAAAALYTEDAMLLPPDSPIVKGRAAIEQFWGAAVAALDLKSASLSTLDVTSVGDSAIEVGTATLLLPSGPANVKFVVAWKRGADGAWRLHRDIWNNGT